MEYKTENYKILKPLLDNLFDGIKKHGYGYGFDGRLKNSDSNIKFWLCSTSEDKHVYIKFIYNNSNYEILEDIFNLNIIKDIVEVIDRGLIKQNDGDLINEFKKELKQNSNINNEALNTYLKQL